MMQTIYIYKIYIKKVPLNENYTNLFFPKHIWMITE